MSGDWCSHDRVFDVWCSDGVVASVEPVVLRGVWDASQADADSVVSAGCHGIVRAEGGVRVVWVCPKCGRRVEMRVALKYPPTCGCVKGRGVTAMTQETNP